MLITNLIRLKILSHFLWAMIFVFPAGTRDVIMLNRERVSEITAEGKARADLFLWLQWRLQQGEKIR